MRANLFLSLLLLVPAFSFYSCNETEKPITKDEAMNFARKLEISIGKRDPAFMDDAMDIKTLMKKANIPNNSNDFNISDLKSGAKMGSIITKALSKDGNYIFIREYEKGIFFHLIFRLYDNGGLNYHDIELIRKAGQIKIADIYIYVTGEKISETLRNLYLQTIDESGNSYRSGDSSDWTSKLPEIRDLVNAGKYKEAILSYNAIPNKYKSNKIAQLLHIKISSGLSDQEYIDALNEYRMFFPNEPNIPLLMIGAYKMQKEYDKALRAVNELDSQINKDPFLDYHRYLCYNLLNEKDKALKCIEQLVKNEPDFGKGQLELIANYLEQHEYDKAKSFVEKYRSRREFDQGNLDRLLMRYPDFN